jgi:Reverse transcriptase (RNA-dependent DNA polymerase)
LVDLLDGIKPIKNKWVFKRKTNMDGNLTVYKACLVAKGFTQVEEIDYDETFSPVAKFQSIRILLAIVVFYNYEIWQIDVKIAFFNGVLDEDVCMVQPDGFIDPKRARNIRFDDEIKKNRFHTKSKRTLCL